MVKNLEIVAISVAFHMLVDFCSNNFVTFHMSIDIRIKLTNQQRNRSGLTMRPLHDVLTLRKIFF
jgi:hypothetical protein